METQEISTLKVATTIAAPVEKVWRYWTEPQHITQWNNASADWHTPHAENDLRVGGKFISRMEAKDGSWGFDFTGTYTQVIEHHKLEYALEDGRKVEITFQAQGHETIVTEIFDAEKTHSLEMQQTGWQAILDNFKKYVEAAGELIPLHFQITINSTPEKVYRTMLDENHYRTWTVPFQPTSHYRGSWEKGAKILFLGTDENGQTGGMVSRIKENIPNQFVSIEHLGLVQNNEEITTGEAVAGWAGALENYTFREQNGQTLLSIDTDTNQEFKDLFSDIWPQALEKLKAICEA